MLSIQGFLRPCCHFLQFLDNLHSKAILLFPIYASYTRAYMSIWKGWRNRGYFGSGHVHSQWYAACGFGSSFHPWGIGAVANSPAHKQACYASAIFQKTHPKKPYYLWIWISFMIYLIITLQQARSVWARKRAANMTWLLHIRHVKFFLLATCWYEHLHAMLTKMKEPLHFACHAFQEEWTFTFCCLSFRIEEGLMDINLQILPELIVNH